MKIEEIIEAIRQNRVTNEHATTFWQNAIGCEPGQAVTSLKNRYRNEWRVGNFTIVHVDAPRRFNGQEHYVKTWKVEDEERNTVAQCDGEEFYIVRSTDGYISVWSETAMEGLDREIISGPFASRWEAKEHQHIG